MKGLLYKDIMTLVKGMKPIHYLIFIIGLIAAFVKGDEWGSFFATALLSYFVCIFSTRSILYDEQARWKKYEVTLPTGRRKSIIIKYIFALLNALFCAIIATLFFFVNVVIVGELNWAALLLQVGFAILFPILWNAVSLPISYWIGYQASSYVGIVVMVPMFYLMRYFKSGFGTLATSNSLTLFVWISIVCTIALLGLSYGICTEIHRRKEYK